MESDDKQLDDLRARLAARREQMDRNSQAIDNGTADARVFEALKLGAEPGAYIERRAQLGPEEVNRRLLRAAGLES
jgi:hypothetical protein